MVGPLNRHFPFWHCTLFLTLIYVAVELCFTQSFINYFANNTTNLKTEKVLNVRNVHLHLYSWRAYFHSSNVHVPTISPKVGRIKANTDHLTERMEYSVNQGKTWRLVPDTWPIASYNPILLRTRSGSREHGNIKIRIFNLLRKIKANEGEPNENNFVSTNYNSFAMRMNGDVVK